MGLHFFESNQVEQVIPALCQRLQNNPTLLQPHRFVVSGFGTEQWLIQQISHTQGVFANAYFQFPRNFIHSLADLFDLPPIQTFTRDALVLRLYQLFERERQQANSPFLDGDCWQYLQITNRTVLQRRLLELSLNFAQLFDEYQWQRPDWLVAWQNHDDQQPTLAPPGIKQAQQCIWRYLLEQKDCQQAYDTVSQQLYKLIRLLKCIDPVQTQKLNDFAQQIHVVGLTAMQHPIWSLCQALSEVIEVYFYLFNPSRELWSEQLFSPYRENQLLQQQRDNTTSQQTNRELFHLHHPLLMAFGQHGAGFQQLFINHDDKQQVDYFVNPIEQSNNLLHCCQQRILEDSKQPFTDLPPPQLDDSLSIHVCEDAKHELLHLRIHLFEWLAKHEDATLGDVLIVSPAMQEYTAWIPTVFADTPYTFANHTHHPHSLLMGFQHFLTLLNSDFYLTDIKLFWTQTAHTRDKEQRNQLDELLRLYEQFGFRFGTTPEHRQHLGFSDERSLTHSMATIWRAMLTSTDYVSLSWKPLVVINNELLDLAKQWQIAQHPKTLAQWLEQFQQWLKQLYQSRHTWQHDQTLTRLIDDLQQTTTLCGFQQQFNFQQMRQLWQYKTSESSVVVQYLANKLQFSDMLATCGIPKKFIAVLGLNATFPSQSKTNLLNLSHYQSRLTDRHPSREQRYQFLEYLCAARERLWLSYSKTDEKTAQSPVLKQVRQYIKTAGGVLQEQHHPPFNTPLWRLNLTTPALKPQPFDDKQLPKHSIVTNDLLSVMRLSEQVAEPLRSFYRQHRVALPRLPTPLTYSYQTQISPLEKAKLMPEIYRLLLCTANPTDSMDSMDNASIAQHVIQECAIHVSNYLRPEVFYEQLDELITDTQKSVDKLNLGSWQDPQRVRYKQLSHPDNKALWLYSQEPLQRNNDHLFIGYRFKTKTLLHGWLYHLMTEESHTTTLLFFDKKGTLDKPIFVSFKPLEQSSKNDCLLNILNYHQQLLQQPLLIFPQLLNDFLQQQDWQKAIVQKHTFNKDGEWQKMCNTSEAYDWSVGGAVHQAHQEFKQQVFADYLPEKTI